MCRTYPHVVLTGEQENSRNRSAYDSTVSTVLLSKSCVARSAYDSTVSPVLLSKNYFTTGLMEMA